MRGDIGCIEPFDPADSAVWCRDVPATWGRIREKSVKSAEPLLAAKPKVFQSFVRGRLVAALCHHVPPKKEHVYFIQSSDGRIKIGVSNHPEKRLASLQTGHAGELRLLATTPGDYRVERDWHARFAIHRLRGEWFYPAADLLEAIAALRNP